jgi:hypothetical protein
VVEQVLLAGVGDVHAAHRDGDDLGAGRLRGPARLLERAVLAAADDEPRAILAARDDEGIDVGHDGFNRLRRTG